MAIDKNRLVREINTSFIDIPYPNGKDFYKAIADKDYEEYVCFDKKKEWFEITKHELIKYYDFIFFLDSNAVIYYLPAYMRLIIEDEDIADHQATECLFMALTEIDASWLNKKQRQAISDFLIYCRDVINPKIGLDTYLLEAALEHYKQAHVAR